MSKAYRDLVEAVQSLCLAAADDGTAPEEWSLGEALEPLARALLVEAAESARLKAWETFEPVHQRYQNGEVTVMAIVLPQHIWIGAENATRAMSDYTIKEK